MSKKGFTLIEMLVVVSLFSLVALISTGFLFTTLHSSSKAEITKGVRQNGNYALGVMERMIRNAYRLQTTCPNADPTQIKIKNHDGGETTFSCEEEKIASNGAYLTSDEVILSPGSCQFTCTASSGKAPTVTIEFVLIQPSATLKAYETGRLEFKSVVNLRNY